MQPGVVGQEWNNFAEGWGTLLIYAPTGSSHSSGLVERQIDSFKNVLAKLLTTHPTENANVLINRGVLSKNMTPTLSTGMSPMQCMLGGSDLLSSLENEDGRRIIPDREGEMVGGPMLIQNHLEEIAEMRGFLCRIDANKIIDISAARNLRAHMKLHLRTGDEIEVYQPLLETWRGGYRLLGQLESHGIIEKGREISRYPVARIRRRLQDAELIIPNESSSLSNGRKSGGVSLDKSG